MKVHKQLVVYKLHKKNGDTNTFNPFATEGTLFHGTVAI